LFKKISVLFVLLVMLFSMTASASSYRSYVYDNNGTAQEAPDAMVHEKTIYLQEYENEKGRKMQPLSDSADLCMGDDNNLYIVDKGNNRIVVMNAEDYSIVKEIKTFRNDGMKDSLYQPEGIFVAKDLSLYICDTGNGRLVHLDKDGNLLNVIKDGVKSEVLPKKFQFSPSKVAVDSAGRIFVINNNFTMGLLEIDANGGFVQTLGAPAVTYNAVELIWRAISTEEQRKRMQDFVPTEFNSITIDDEDFVYVTNDVFDQTTVNDVEMISRLNAKGSDVLRKLPETNPYGDNIGVWTGQYKGPSRLTDVVTMDYGMYMVLDNNRNRVFFYNNDGANLFEFGAPPDTSDNVHTVYTDDSLITPVAIEWYNGKCFVLDVDNGDFARISVFKTTSYGELIMEATELHYQDKYDEEAVLWEQVLTLNANSAAAKQSLGKVAYRNGEWNTAMEYFKEINDPENYSKAYKYARRDLISNNFTWGIIAIVAFIVLIIVLKKLRKKYLPPVKEDSFLGKLSFSKRVIFRPLNSYWSLTRENKGSVAAATVLLLGAAFAKLIQARFTGFIFDSSAERANIFMEFATVVAPLLLFVVCNWCVTSLLNGEGNLKAIYISSCYALTPMIFLYPIATIISTVMLQEEGEFYVVFISIALFWVALLLFSSVMRVHDYTLGWTIIIIFITLIVMLLVVFLSVLFFALLQQMYGFITDIMNEIATRA
jgi:hypothetical protein